MENNLIDNLYDIKKMGIMQLCFELRTKMDPDVAACAAWYIKHAEHPKSWTRWYAMAYSRMDKYNVRDMPRRGFTKRIWDIIGEHYRACHLYGRKCKLI